MPSKAARDARKTAWGTGADLSAVGRWLRLTPRKSHYNKSVSYWRTADCCLLRGDTYQASQDGEGSDYSTNKSQSYHNGRVGGVILEDVVNLRQLSISRSFGGRDGDVDIALDRKLKDGVIIGLRATEATNYDASVNGIGESQELEGEFFLGLFGLGLAYAETSFVRAGAITNSRRDFPFSLTVKG